jgi:hypothetical protein
MALMPFSKPTKTSMDHVNLSSVSVRLAITARQAIRLDSAGLTMSISASTMLPKPMA